MHGYRNGFLRPFIPVKYMYIRSAYSCFLIFISTSFGLGDGVDVDSSQRPGLAFDFAKTCMFYLIFSHLFLAKTNAFTALFMSFLECVADICTRILGDDFGTTGYVMLWQKRDFL